MTNCDRVIGNTASGGSNSSNSDVDNLNSRYDSLSTNHIDACTISIIHSNCQSAMNKKSELVNLIDAQRPHILALTEFGASNMIMDNELGIEGYTLYRNNHSDGSGGPGKGAALYVKNSLNHSAAPSIDELVFDCSAWSIIKLKGNKAMLVGVVYRSPSSTAENNEKLLSLLRAAANANCQYLSICGDFNLPLVDWSVNHSPESENAYSSEFVRCAVEELALFQHVNSNTRFRGAQSSCLDLIFTNEEGMVNEVRELPPIGKSDHICQQWDVIISEPMFRNTSVLRPNFKRARWEDLKTDLRGFENGPENQPSEMYNDFVTMINHVKDKHIPKCKPKTNRHRLPWMKAPKIKKQRTTQLKRWKRYK